MKDPKQHGRELFSQRFHQIEEGVDAVARQQKLSLDERQELYSLTMLKVIQDDYRALRAFKGQSRWQTYLRAIIQRVLLDRRVKEWGRWRPCGEARRLGGTAIELDRRINRDGQDPAEAIREMLARGVDETAAEMEKLAEKVPCRPRRQFTSGEAFLEVLTARERADHRLEAGERRRAAAHLNSVLSTALRELSGQERQLLGMRFGGGWTVRRIAASQNLKEPALYRRFARVLSGLRCRLEGLGLSWEEIADAFDGREVDLEIGLDQRLPGFRSEEKGPPPASGDGS